MARYPQLEQTALRLKKTAPDQHRDLIRELTAIRDGVYHALVNTELPAIYTMQGRCQQVQDLLAALDPPEPKRPDRAYVPFSA